MPALAGKQHHRGIPRWIENTWICWVLAQSLPCRMIICENHGGDAVILSYAKISGGNIWMKPEDLDIFRTIQGSFMGCLKIRNGILMDSTSKSPGFPHHGATVMKALRKKSSKFRWTTAQFFWWNHGSIFEKKTNMVLLNLMVSKYGYFLVIWHRHPNWVTSTPTSVA